MKDTQVNHFKILERLGGGAMGVVYKAEDLKLRRTVALKFLPGALLRDDAAKDRFRREAQAASGLDHPNVCTIYEIDETEDGQLFIAMACYEGETLRAKIERGPLSIDSAISYTRQAALGLDEAHRKGILHRDIKPANLFVTREGQIKLLDFGLAKVADDVGLTRSGTSLGTPIYMAPEQVSGVGDARSDLWSLGVVLYEMLTGCRPFSGSGPAAFYGVLHHDPPPIQEQRSGVPSWLVKVVGRALAKDPARRYGSARELAADLEASGTQEQTLEALPSARSGAPLPQARTRRGRVGVLAALALLAAAVIVFVPRRGTERPEPASEALPAGDAVAVLPFSYRGHPESDYLGEGMVDLLSAKLDGTGSLFAVDPRALLSYLGNDPIDPGDPSQAARLAERFEAGRFLLGNLVDVGGQVHLDASLYRVTKGAPREIAKATAEGDLNDLFALVDEVAAQLLAAHLDMGDGELTRLASLTTDSFPALRSYLVGESDFRNGRITDAAAALERAVAEDPHFALAWYRLSLVKEFLFETAAAQQASDEAARHAERLSLRHRLLVSASNFASHDRATEADRLFRRILRSYPTSVEAWYGWGELLFHCGPLRGSPLAAAREPWEKMLAFEPKNAVAALHLARIEFAAGRLEELGELSARMTEILGRDDEAEILLFRATVAEAGDTTAETLLLESLRRSEASSIRWLLATGLPYVRTRADLDAAARRVGVLLEDRRSPGEQAFGHRALAVLDAARGRFEAAREGLLRAAALVPAYEDELEPLLRSLPFAPASREELAESYRDLRDRTFPARSGELTEDDLLPHAALRPQLHLYQLGLLSALLGDPEAVRFADQLAAAAAPSPELACLGGDLARGVRAAVARAGHTEPRARAEETLRALEGRQCECNYQTALASPLVSHVRERYLRAEALHVLERYDEALPFYASLSEAGIFDAIYLAPSHLRRGEIHLRRGDLAAAREHLGHFVELWGEGDAALLPRVEEAQRQLAELEAR